MQGIVIVLCSVLAVVISALSYFMQKGKIAKFESNCIATLNTKMENVEKLCENHHTDIAKLFDELKGIDKRLSYLEGRTNGKSHQ